MNNPLQRAFQCWPMGTQRGGAFGVWASRSISLLQLRRMSLKAVPWSPLWRPLAEMTVALVPLCW